LQFQHKEKLNKREVTSIFATALTEYLWQSFHSK